MTCTPSGYLGQLSFSVSITTFREKDFFFFPPVSSFTTKHREGGAFNGNSLYKYKEYFFGELPVASMLTKGRFHCAAF